MEQHVLSFAKINAISPHMAEVIVNDGVDMTDELVEGYHRSCLNSLPRLLKFWLTKSIPILMISMRS